MLVHWHKYVQWLTELKCSFYVYNTMFSINIIFQFQDSIQDLSYVQLSCLCLTSNLQQCFFLVFWDPDILVKYWSIGNLAKVFSICLFWHFPMNGMRLCSEKNNAEVMSPLCCKLTEGVDMLYYWQCDP